MLFLTDEVVARNVERLCTVEMRTKGMPRGFIHKLNNIVEEKFGSPSTILAAQEIIKRANKQDNVLICTGAGIVPWVARGETDGPLGAAALAAILSTGLNLKPIFVTEKKNILPIRASSESLGMKFASPRQFKTKERTALVKSYPYEDEESRRVAPEILDEYRPSLIITTEKLSPNEKGIIHTVRGSDHTHSHAKVHHLINEAMRRGILTVGIGDGGNEIGFGLIKEDVKRVVPYGSTCQCPCQSGIAAQTSTDFLVVASISNWGAYGLEACLAGLLGRIDLMHSPEDEQRMLQACVKMGGTDALSLKRIPSVDGVTSQINRSVVAMLRETVKNGSKDTTRIF